MESNSNRSGRRLTGTLMIGLVLAGLIIGTARLSRAGANPHPVHLLRPAAKPLSAVALLGRAIFFDPDLSGSGRISCASCHSPANAYGPPNNQPAQFGGRQLNRQGNRAVPSLRYVYRTPNFSIGPDNAEAENVNLVQQATQARDSKRVQKLAGSSASATALVPQGGMFWDGRVNTLQDQAMGPLFNPAEMANTSVAAVAAKLARASYHAQFAQLFGVQIFRSPARLVDEALFAVARFQVEDPSFHPYTSKYDYYLEGKARLSASELRGLKLFNDIRKANCAGCHLDQPGKDGRPPLFTDHQYEALGVPRNPALEDNRNPRYYDLGLCGPLRSDLKKQTQYCGMFLTPTLRNVATRQVFFHNGEYHTLQQVLAFYDFRDTEPARIYPRGPHGETDKFDDLPAEYRGNVDITDPPFNRRPGEQPAMSAQDMRDIIAFLGTLTDGYHP